MLQTLERRLSVSKPCILQRRCYYRERCCDHLWTAIGEKNTSKTLRAAAASAWILLLSVLIRCSLPNNPIMVSGSLPEAPPAGYLVLFLSIDITGSTAFK